MSKNMFTLASRTKILIIMICGCLVILLDSATALFFCFLASLSLVAISKPTFRQIKLLIIFLFFSTWGLVYSQGMFYNAFPRTVLITLIPTEFPLIGELTGGIRIYKEGLFHGIIQSMRFNVTLAVGCYIIWSTQPRDLLLAMTQLRIPGALAFMVTTALRFIPLIAQETSSIVRSQRLRGFRYLRFNLIATARGLINSFRPILVGNIRHAANLGVSVESRGFSIDKVSERTSLRNIKLELSDYSLIVTLTMLLIVVIAFKILYFCYANGLYYVPWLRHIYTFTREVL